MFSESTSYQGMNEGLAIATTMSPLLVFGAIFLIGIVFIIYGVIGAIMASLGKPFRYVIIGKRVERFMLAGQTEADAGVS
jgi:hypothetical protein